MTPNIRPFLQRAIDQYPHRWAENTYESCGFILQETLRRAGAEWQHVGKASVGDGESYRPPGFQPFTIELARPDGERQEVRIVGVSHDAAWHVPSGRQVKVIVNSAANSDPRPEIHGPARIGGDIIPVEFYRWHNPPVPQMGSGPITPPPNPPTQQPPMPTQPPGREEALDEMNWLDRYYASPEGLQRPNGLSLNGKPDFEGIAAWYLDVYQRERMKGRSRADARAAYVSDIRHSDEWKQKHPGETP